MLSLQLCGMKVLREISSGENRWEFFTKLSRGELVHKIVIFKKSIHELALNKMIFFEIFPNISL